MPKVAIGQYAKQDERLSKVIKTQMIDTDTSMDKLVKKVQISQSTYFNHINHPEKMSIKYLRRYIRALRIPKEDIIDALYLD